MAETCNKCKYADKCEKRNAQDLDECEVFYSFLQQEENFAQESEHGAE